MKAVRELWGFLDPLRGILGEVSGINSSLKEMNLLLRMLLLSQQGSKTNGLFSLSQGDVDPSDKGSYIWKSEEDLFEEWANDKAYEQVFGTKLREGEHAPPNWELQDR